MRFVVQVSFFAVNRLCFVQKVSVSALFFQVKAPVCQKIEMCDARLFSVSEKKTNQPNAEKLGFEGLGLKELFLSNQSTESGTGPGV